MCHRRMLGDGPSDWFWQHRVSSECAMWIRQVNIKSYTSIFSLNQHDATVAPTEELQKVQRWLTVNHQVVLHILQQQTGLCLFCLFCFLMKQTRQTATQERSATENCSRADNAASEGRGTRAFIWNKINNVTCLTLFYLLLELMSTIRSESCMIKEKTSTDLDLIKSPK